MGDVLRVFDKVRKEIPSKLILVGDGHERGNIEKLCRELDTCNDIHSLGKIIDPKEILSIGDLFVLTSETESFGLSALEAMAMKMPVISTNTGGLPEVNEHGITGFLSNVGDIDDMAKNALKLFRNSELLDQLKKQAYEKAVSFDIQNILPLYEILYNKVLRKQKQHIN